MVFKKSVSKIVVFTPFYFPLIFFTSLILNTSFSLVSTIILAILVALIQTVSNVFDYDYYNDMKSEDYLESKHTFKITYSEDIWNKIKTIEKVNNYKFRVLESTNETISYEIILKGINSKIEFKKQDSSIVLNVQKKFLSFLPDKALNYKICRKIIHSITS